jgi:hypothetical protein
VLRVAVRPGQTSRPRCLFSLVARYAGRLRQAPRQVACAVHNTCRIQAVLIVAIENEMTMKGSGDQPTPQVAQLGMIKVPPPAQLRVFRQFLQRRIHLQQVAPGNVSVRFPLVPPELRVKVSKESIGLADRQAHEPTFSRRKRSAMASRSRRE